jgi:hypothetical protein
MLAYDHPSEINVVPSISFYFPSYDEMNLLYKGDTEIDFDSDGTTNKNNYNSECSHMFERKQCRKKDRNNKVGDGERHTEFKANGVDEDKNGNKCENEVVDDDDDVFLRVKNGQYAMHVWNSVTEDIRPPLTIREIFEGCGYLHLVARKILLAAYKTNILCGFIREQVDRYYYT